MQTLEQQRAAFAWEKVQRCTSDYKNLAKGAPALIMNNGLMQALAFYQSKGKEHHLSLNRHLCEWLRQRAIVGDASFAGTMAELHQAGSARYRLATEEALAVLKWIRQFAAALA
ncbi:CRISPR-associated Cmr5 family protein [Methylocaldum marinum]|uniref:CRISPR type III-B/RAMP module-associated protein Cmr5 n=1 Tax=Methylocaldum marinum TaxID=1432792 RepID=A0A250KWT9_9GAMM|nr:type III-B CRISPR module-associated protein Cmr5 [Methylocaldum marinum]BBA36062.1 CRISPR-associated Cmr5 family protein [Methylocaldum marinum]